VTAHQAVHRIVTICRVLEHGLLRASFVPPAPFRELRELTCWPLATRSSSPPGTSSERACPTGTSEAIILTGSTESSSSVTTPGGSPTSASWSRLLPQQRLRETLVFGGSAHLRPNDRRTGHPAGLRGGGRCTDRGRLPDQIYTEPSLTFSDLLAPELRRARNRVPGARDSQLAPASSRRSSPGRTPPATSTSRREFPPRTCGNERERGGRFLLTYLSTARAHAGRDLAS
jgi:hypothetical protein